VTDDPLDDALLERLRSSDPAASLPPADPARLTRLLVDTMSHGVQTPTHDPSSQPADPRRRTPLTWLVAAAAVLVIAGVGAFALFWGEDQPAAPSAKDPGTTVLELSARPPTAGRCAMVTAGLLANQQTAFDGTVTAIADGTVTLDVGHWYRGGGAEQVSVDGPPTDLQALVQAADFQVGQRYLVSANDGYVTVCGYTAPYSDDLAALYTEAFGA